MDIYDKFGEETEKIVKLRLALTEVTKWLEGSPISEEYCVWLSHKEIIEKVKVVLKETE
jgi:hypothetical protein